MTSNTRLSLLDLPPDDILLPHIFSRLSLQTLFRLRTVNTVLLKYVGDYFASMIVLDLQNVKSSKFGLDIFSVITKDSFNLKELSIPYSKDWLTDAVLTPVLGKSPRLQKVDLSGCTRLKHLTIAKLSNLEYLQDLSLRECPWVEPDSLCQLLWLRGLNLIHLDLTGCWEVSDTTVIIIANSCQNLLSLHLAKIYGLTDQSLSQVARCCRKLQHLNIHNCWRVTDRTIQLLAEYCPDIQRLQVLQCRDITEVSLAKLRARGVDIDVPGQAYKIDQRHMDFLKSLKMQI